MNLREAYNAYNTQWQHWMNTEEVYPKEAYWHALDQLVAASAVPANMQPWQHAPAAHLIREWIKFIPSLESGDARQPSANVYDAIKQLMDAKQVIKPQTEDPLTLAEEGVSFEQIAKMQGWGVERLRRFQVAYSIMKRGRGKFVEADLERDGQTPEERERLEVAERNKGDYMKATLEWRDFANQRIEANQQLLAEDADDWTEPPESIQELHAQNVPLWQIAKMWRKSEPEVLAIIQGGNVATIEPSEADLTAEIQAAHKEDESLSHEELAEIFGVSKSIVAEALG